MSRRQTWASFEGYTLQRALKESGGDPTQLYELDIVRGRADDMMADDAKYAALLPKYALLKRFNKKTLISISEDHFNKIIIFIEILFHHLYWKFQKDLYPNQ